MKNLAVLCLVCLLAACNSACEFPAAVTEDAVRENYQVVYSPSSGVWNNGGMAEDRIVFTKHVSPGSGSYSEYVSDVQTLYLSSTYEFLYAGRLIGYSEHELKFFEVVYRDGKFEQVELSPAQVRELFPAVEVVLVSEAEGGVITVSRLPFGPKAFLLLNDTPTSYYHYSFENFYGYGTPLKSVLKLTKPGISFFPFRNGQCRQSEPDHQHCQRTLSHERS